MGRTYNVIDADGHILEPLDLWDKYIDPEVRERAPRLVIDDRRQGAPAASRARCSAASRASAASAPSAPGRASSPADTMKYEEGRQGGFDPHARIPDMDLDGIDAAFLYPSLGLFAGAVAGSRPRRRDVPRLQPLARRLLQALSRPPVRRRDAADAVGRPGDRGDALRPRRSSASAAASCGPTPTTAEDAPRPGLRAVLERRPRSSTSAIGFHEGAQQRHADGRRRPLRGRAARSTSSRTRWR